MGKMRDWVNGKFDILFRVGLSEIFMKILTGKTETGIGFIIILLCLSSGLLANEIIPEHIYTLNSNEIIKEAGISANGKSYFFTICRDPNKTKSDNEKCHGNQYPEDIYIDGKLILKDISGTIVFADSMQEKYWYILYSHFKAGAEMYGKPERTHLIDISGKKYGSYDSVEFLEYDRNIPTRYAFSFRKNHQIYVRVGEKIFGPLGNNIYNLGIRLKFSKNGYLLEYLENGRMFMFNDRGTKFGPYSSCKGLNGRAICERPDYKTELFSDSRTMGVFHAAVTLGNYFDILQKPNYISSEDLKTYQINIDGQKYGPYKFPKGVIKSTLGKKNRVESVRNSVVEFLESPQIQLGYAVTEQGAAVSFAYTDMNGYYLQFIGGQKIGPYKFIFKPSFSHDFKHWVVGVREKKILYLLTSDKKRIGPFHDIFLDWQKSTPCRTDFVINQRRLGYIARHFGNGGNWYALMQNTNGDCVPVLSGKSLGNYQGFGFFNGARLHNNRWLLPVKEESAFYVLVSGEKKMGPYDMVQEYNPFISSDGQNWSFVASKGGQFYVIDSDMNEYGPYRKPFQIHAHSGFDKSAANWVATSPSDSGNSYNLILKGKIIINFPGTESNIVYFTPNRKHFVIPLGLNEIEKTNEIILNNKKITGRFWGSEESMIPQVQHDGQGNISSISFLHFNADKLMLYRVTE